MKYINSYKFKNLFDQIISGDYQELTDDVWDALEWDGWIDDASRLHHGKKGEDREDYEFIELDIPEADEFGLATKDEKVLDKYNDFDIELKDKLYDKGYLDLIDYEEGKVRIVKIK